MQAVIDLGEEWEQPPDTERPLRRLSPRTPLALLSLVLVAMLGGSALPRYAMVSLFAVPFATVGTYALDADAVYTVHDSEVTAYRLPDGARRWSAEIGHSVRTLRPMPEAGVVVAEYGTAENRWSGLLALDAKTGRVRWSDSGSRVQDIVDPHRVVLATLHTAPMDSGGMSLSEEVRGVDAATGHTIWSRQARPGSWAIADTAAPRAIFDTADGTTEVLDAATGAMVARARLRSPTGSKPSDTDPDAISGYFALWYGRSVQIDAANGAVLAVTDNRSIVDDRLFLAGSDGTGSLLDVYELSTLAHLWSTRLPKPVLSIGDCDPLLCVYSFSSLTGIDPGTGAIKWSSQALSLAYSLPGGRLLAESTDNTSPSVVLDATSMRTLLTLTGWQRVNGVGDRTLLARADPTSLRTLFAELDPFTLRIRPLAWASGVTIDHCEHSDTYLACPTATNHLRLWHLQDSP